MVSGVKAITQEKLKELFKYNPDTGVLLNKVHRSSNAKVGQRSGTLNLNGYRQIFLYNRCHKEHRLIWLYVTGSWPEQMIDHINGDKSDNRLCNLRDVSRHQNSRNAKRGSANKSGVVGVSFHALHKKWQANIKVNGKLLHLGSECGFFEAVCLRKSAERRYGFHKNHGRG
jgi:hypothetical protein